MKLFKKREKEDSFKQPEEQQDVENQHPKAAVDDDFKQQDKAEEQKPPKFIWFPT